MSERTVKEIVEGQEVVTASATTSVHDAARLMREHNIGALVVVEAEQLVGIFTERDGLFRVLADGLDVKTTQLSTVMTTNPQTIPATSAFTTALQMMQEGRFRNIPVV
jgi:CBS domain-containing protein